MRLARTGPGRILVRWTFAYMSFAIPVKRLHETETLMAFFHPNPDYAFHVVLVAKRTVRDLAELELVDTNFFADLFAAVRALVDDYQLPAYRLILNGGEYQDIPQLHFHLISETAGISRKPESIGS